MSRAASLGVLFAVFQTGNRANGGVESISAIIEGLRDVRRTVLTQTVTPVNERWRKAGCSVLEWSIESLQEQRRSGFRPRHILSLLRTNVRVFRLLARHSIQVVHCNDVYFFWYVALGTRAAGAKLVMNYRATKAKGVAYSWHQKWMPKLSHGVFMLSEDMKEDLLDRLDARDPEKASDGRIEATYSIVDSVRYAPAEPAERKRLRRELGIEDSEVAIGYVAVVSETKGQLGFIERAIGPLRDRLPTARVHFLGDFDPARDPYSARCARALEEQEPSAGIFRGYREDLSAWYRAFDVLVVGSRREGLARCMIEAMACGLPVVSFDVCSAREMLEERGCGIVVEQGDYAGMVAGIVSVVRSEDLRSRMSRNGRATALDLFERERVVRRYRDLYRRVAGDARPEA